MSRIALGLAVAAAVLSVADYSAWRANRGRLIALAAESGLSRRQPELETELARQTASARATARLAWALLALEVDRRWLSELPPDEREAESRRGPERLRLASELAAEVMARQPASWRAATVLGASRYLQAARRRQQDQPISAWRQPLMAAMRLAPGYPEPPIFLASAYLSRWSSLSPGERDELLPVLRRALENQRGLQLLLPPWVRLAPSLDRLLEPIPDRPAAWQELGKEFLRLGDLERFGMAYRRRLDSLPADLADRVQIALARRQGGDARSAISVLQSVFSAPPDLSYADSFSAALATLPEGAADRRARQDLRRWLRWAMDLCSVGRCPLGDEMMQRLADAGSQPGEPGPLDLEIDRPARLQWAREDWERYETSYRLRLRTAQPTQELRLEIEKIPAAGAAMVLRWDGRVLAVTAVEPGEPLIWRFAAAPGLHLLEVEHLSGRPLPPVYLSLEPASARG